MAIRVGIAGITGRLGQLLTSSLIQHENVSIRGLCRNITRVPLSLSSSAKVEIAEGGAFDYEQISKFVKDCDIVVCCYRGDDELMTKGQKMLIDACEREKVPRYMASDWSTDYTKLQFDQSFTEDAKKHIKAYIETKKMVKGVHILNGILFETLFDPSFGIYNDKTHTFSHWGIPGVRFEGLSLSDSVQFTTRAILDQTATGVQRFVGDCKSMNDIALAYGKVYGINAKVVVIGSAEDLRGKMWNFQNTLSSKSPDDKALSDQYFLVSEQTYVGPYIHNPNYPEIQAASFEEFMRRVPLGKLPTAFQHLVSERVEKSS